MISLRRWAILFGVGACHLCVSATWVRAEPADLSSAPDRGGQTRRAFDDHTTIESVGASSLRVAVNSPADTKSQASNQTRLMIYALPNGNTLEQTLGCTMQPGLDWHYDIQHVAAQVRMLRELDADERLVLVCAEAGGLSWPTWRSSRPNANAEIGALLDQWRTRLANQAARVTLTGHSGGGSFIFGVIEAFDEIPAYIDRIAILDANYAFDASRHATKLLRWLTGDDSRRLIVLAYDDRNIELNGKRVVGPDGGTFRATGRMVEAFKPDIELAQSQNGPFIEYSGLEGRVHFYVHANPQNKILHTALVGDMNGLIHAQTLGTSVAGKWGQFGGPRAYAKWIQAEPIHAATDAPSTKTSRNSASASAVPVTTIPPRPVSAIGGVEFMERIRSLSREDREAAILEQITSGNIPDCLRQFKSVPIVAGELQGVIEVMPDYLAVGSDDDFVRIPMNPQTAQAIADRFGCTLPTRKMVDAVDAAAEVRLAPQPLVENRESVAAFLLSNDKIDQQRQGQPLGALTIGAKKDVVLSPRIFERPDRVCIYGWRRLDGKPIQPLTNVHVNWYVDYSHGIRLVDNEMTAGDQPALITDLLQDGARCQLVSDEGPIVPPRYPQE